MSGLAMWHVLRRGNTHKILVGKHEVKRALERPRPRWDVILRSILKKQNWKAWTELMLLRIRNIGGLMCKQ